MLTRYLTYLGPLSTDRIRTEVRASKTECLDEGLIYTDIEKKKKVSNWAVKNVFGQHQETSVE